jgi:DNA-binding MarR family transcriptional regulator
MTLLRLAGAVKHLTLADSQGAGLTPVQAQTLLFTRHTKRLMTSVGNLAAALGTTHVSAVGVINGLVARGLLAKEASVADRRVTLLRLTPAGEQVCDTLDRWAGALEASLAALPPGDLAALERTLGAVVHSLRSLGVLVVAEPCRGCVHFRPDAQPGRPEPHHCALIDAYLSEEETRRECPDFTGAGAPAPRLPVVESTSGHGVRSMGEG